MAVTAEDARVNLNNLPEDVIWRILSFSEERDLDNIRLVSSDRYQFNTQY